MENMSKNMDNIDLEPPFQVRTAGLIHNLPYHSTPGTREHDTMLMVFLAGRGFYRNASGSRVVTPGTIALIPPRDPGILMAEPKNPYTHYYCRFNGHYALHLAETILKTRGDRFFPVADIEDIADHLRRMGPLFRIHLPRHMDLPAVLLAEILVRLAYPASTSLPQLSTTAIEQYLVDHLAEPNDLDRMAAHFGLSKATLCRLSRKLFDRTLVDLAEEKKIHWAKVLLEIHGLNVSEAARRVGYHDPFYFSRVFKKRMGKSPTSCRPRTSDKGNEKIL